MLKNTCIAVWVEHEDPLVLRRRGFPGNRQRVTLPPGPTGCAACADGRREEDMLVRSGAEAAGPVGSWSLSAGQHIKYWHKCI